MKECSMCLHDIEEHDGWNAVYIGDEKCGLTIIYRSVPGFWEYPICKACVKKIAYEMLKKDLGYNKKGGA